MSAQPSTWPISLAGPAAAGKSTVCKLVEKLYGIECVEVEAPECYDLPPAESQLCFVHSFRRQIEEQQGRRVVLSNSLLTVMAYSLCRSGLDLDKGVIIASLAKRLSDKLEPLTITLLAEPSTLMKRSEKRGYHNESVETDKSIVSCVVEILRTISPVIVNTERVKAEEAARLVARLAGVACNG